MVLGQEVPLPPTGYARNASSLNPAKPPRTQDHDVCSIETRSHPQLRTGEDPFVPCLGAIRVQGWRHQEVDVLGLNLGMKV